MQELRALDEARRGFWGRGSLVCGGSRKAGGWMKWKDRDRIRQTGVNRCMDRWDILEMVQFDPYLG